MTKQSIPSKQTEPSRDSEGKNILIVKPGTQRKGSVSSRYQTDENGNSRLLSIEADGDISFRYYPTEKDFLDDES